MEKRHLRLVPSEPATGDELNDSLIRVMAEVLRVYDDRLFLGKIGEVTAPEGRYFEATAAEVAEWIGDENPLNVGAATEHLREIEEQFGWGIYVWLPDEAVCRITAD